MLFRSAEGRSRRWRDRKKDYLVHLRRSTPEAVAISLADKLHNLWTMNQSLARGLDIFTEGPNRKALRAGKEEQRWYFESVLTASEVFSDPRLAPMRARLTEELDRFCSLTGVRRRS